MYVNLHIMCTLMNAHHLRRGIHVHMKSICTIINLSNNVYHRNNERKFYCTENHLTGCFILHLQCVTCKLLLSKNCVERDCYLISLVLTMVKLVNMSCDKILNEVSFVYDKM